MEELRTLEDIADLRESAEVECKLAAGRDGRGKIPEDLWATYSAFANTNGGYIVLGIQELADSFSLVGVQEPQQLIKEFFDLVNNKQKISANLIDNDSVSACSIQGKTLVLVQVPSAGRKSRPVHVGQNPMTGTYRRHHDGDRKCDAAAVRRMLAEQVEDSRDDRVLQNYTMKDLNAGSISIFRQMLAARSPSHPFLEVSGLDFVRKLRGWRQDRDSGKEGLTVAGLLMFGQAEAIKDEFENYTLDYQERAEAKATQRWVDRVTIDGTWSGNILDFYLRVYRKLITDLKIPFRLQDGQRLDDTPVHVALREALVNAIVHADYTGRASILVVKRPDMFGFRNPGLMRVPVAQAFAGGESDGRNRTLQQMFLLIGAGERAGSGLPKIAKGWKDQHWIPPRLYEREGVSEQTLLELRMADLLPAESVSKLHDLFGVRYDKLSPNERVLLATAATEGVINHARANSICDIHPVDLTRLLQGLVQNAFLAQTGRGRGAVYHLPGMALPDPQTAFSEATPMTKGAELNAKGADLDPKGTELTGKSLDLATNSDPYANSIRGRVIAGLRFPIVDDLSGISAEEAIDLRRIASETERAGKVPTDIMWNTVRGLCSERFVTLRVLAELLGRQEGYLRQRVLNPMVEADVLQRAFPQSPNHPRQAYTSTQLLQGAG